MNDSTMTFATIAPDAQGSSRNDPLVRTGWQGKPTERYALERYGRRLGRLLTLCSRKGFLGFAMPASEVIWNR
jgi:hypothetical protein